jgi:hypothetical protein
MKTPMHAKSLSDLAANVAAAKENAARCPASPFNLAPVAWLKVLIAYEDITTGQRAMKLCAKLIDQLGSKYQFRTCLWRFDLLRVAKLIAIAAQDANESDLVLISTHDCGELPAAVKKWMAAWPGPAPPNAKALVALLERAGETAPVDSPVQSYLQAFAEKSRFDFFSQSVPRSTARSESSSERLAWGINE